MKISLRQSLLLGALICAVAPAGFGAQAPAPAANPAAPTAVPAQGGAVASAANATLTVKEVANFVPVTDAMMRAPKPEDWLMYRGNYAGWGYSPLEQVNKDNVKNLRLAWSRAMGPGNNEITPIVYNGVMYLANPNDVIQAIDAVTGSLLWEYKHPLPPRATMHNNQGEHHRSIAIYGDYVIFVSFDNIVIGLDAKTGRRAWANARGGDGYVTNSSGPIIANGMIVAGSTANGFGGGYVSGHDAKNGEELWRKEVIPHPGEPGDETWITPFEQRWHTGAWGHLTYDPDLDLVYYGTSGVAPAPEAERKAPGATLYGSDTRFAVHPKSGEIVWRHQTLPRDNWDQECTFEMMVINTPVNPDANAQGMLSVNPDARKGPRKTLTGIPCKTGIAWSFDAANGEFLWAKQTVEQNLVKTIDPKGQVTVNEDMVMKDLTKTYQICPTYAGGRDWPMGAYSPKTNAFFMPMSNMCISSKGRTDRPSSPANGYNTTNVGRFATGKDKVGRIDAISAETGRTVWSWETRVSNYSPVLATGGGLVFNGGMDRYLRALDIDNGQVVWETRLPSQVVGGAISFSVGGRQYIAVSAGGGALAGMQIGLTPEADTTPGSNAIYVFALPQ